MRLAEAVEASGKVCNGGYYYGRVTTVSIPWNVSMERCVGRRTTLLSDVDRLPTLRMTKTVKLLN